MVPLLVIEEPDLNAALLNGSTAPAGFHWAAVPNGSDALDRMQREPCALLLMGLNPAESKTTIGMLSVMRSRHPSIPVVVLGSRNPSDGILRDVLRTGVAGCLPKENVASDLARTVHLLLSDSRGVGEVEGQRRFCFTLGNSPELLPVVVEQMRSLIQDWPFTDPLEPVRMSVALSEALDNALYHGNLDLDSALRQGDGCDWREESRRRRSSLPYRDRRIRFQARIGHDTATFTVSDEGNGFDPSRQEECTDPQNLERCSGRGLMLMRMYMDKVTFNAAGNEVTLVKRRPGICLPPAN